MRNQKSPVLENDSYLHPLLTRDQAIAAYRKRRDPYEYMSGHPAQEEELVAKGWDPYKQTKTKLKLRRRKDHDADLEDRVWSLVYRMGYPVLSDRNFRATYRRSDRTLGKKQLDVFCKDDETCLVIECKSREQRGKRSLQKDLHETEALQKPIADAIRHQFGVQLKLKIIWIYVTNNIIWSEEDLDRAAAANIRVVTENELQYFDQFISHLGPAGRFQFLAEFLQGQPIPNLTNVRVPAVRGQLGKYPFYSFVISPRHLLKIAFVNHQALNHPDGRPAYQRMINKARIKKIGKFIRDGGYFPTNILVNFIEKCRFDLLPNKENADRHIKFGWLYLPNKYKSAWIIDGQHRLYGYSHLDDAALDQNLFVLAFEKMDTQTEAELFVTINHEQKSVPKNLLIALQADLKLGSSEPRERLSALASALVRTLSVDSTSPFFGRITVPGITPAETQNLTIPEIVKGIMRSTLLGRVLQRQSTAPGYYAPGTTDDKTLLRARRITNFYFRALMDANVARWNAGRSAFICVNPGIRAHFQLQYEILRYLENQRELDPFTATEEEVGKRLVVFISPILKFIRDVNDNEIADSFARKFGEGGVKEYFFRLCDLLQSAHSGFGPKEYHDHCSKQKDVRQDRAREITLDLQGAIVKFVVSGLKKIHGENRLKSGESAFWSKGIQDASIKQEAYKKQQGDPPEKQAPIEGYLELVDCIKIVKQPENWPHFETVLNIPPPGDKSNKKYHLDWIEAVNRLRRIAAHKTDVRNFEEEDLEYLDWIRGELYRKFESVEFEP